MEQQELELILPNWKLSARPGWAVAVKQFGDTEIIIEGNNPVELTRNVVLFLESVANGEVEL